MQLEDIKIVCVDFDATLYIHPKDCLRSTIIDRTYFRMSMASEIDYKDSIHPKEMHKFLQIIQHHSPTAKFFMISHVMANFIVDNKKIAVLRDYPEIKWTDFYGCSSSEHKASILDCLCYTYHCESSEVMMIDDYPTVLRSCMREGYHVVNAQDVINRTLSIYDAEVHGLVPDWKDV